MGARTPTWLRLSHQTSAGSNKHVSIFFKQITLTNLEVSNSGKQVHALARSNTQSHTPAALTRNRPVPQRSSPRAGGGACRSC